MKRSNISEARDAAITFVDAVDRYNARYVSDDEFYKFCEMVGYKEAGDVRRKSMDLTRALSQMRKP